MIKILSSFRPLKIIGWGLVLYLLGMFIINPLIMLTANVTFFEIYKDTFLGILAHLFGVFFTIGIGIAYLYISWGYNKPTVSVKKVTKDQDAINTPLNHVITPELVDITKGVQNRHLKPGVKAKKILIGDQEADLYQLNDLIFDLNTTPHCLIVGETGSGKSVSSFNLLTLLNKQFRYPQTVLLDAGNQDFENAIAHRTGDIIKAFDLLYYIVKGRQCEPKGTNFTPLLIVLEEAETYMRTINTIFKKDEYDKLIMKLANMILVGRKLNINFLFLAQTAKAVDLPTEIRGQFGNRFYLRLNKTAGRMYSIPYKLNNIPSGIAYYEKIEAFVEFENLTDPPPLNTLTFNQLKTMAANAKFKHNIKEDSELEI